MRPAHPAAAACALALAAAGCGGGEDRAAGGPERGAALTVTVRPEGPRAPARRVEVRCEELGGQASTARCRRLGGLTRADLAPVPDSVACAQVYGGPAVARVSGSLRGERVSARFSLRDACEIERWRRNRALLGDPPRAIAQMLRVRPPSTSNVTPVM
jgi:hypothetical protein